MKALIIGRAACVWDDLSVAPDVGPDWQIIAVNVVGCDLSFPIHHWVSFHAEAFPFWLERRASRGYPPAGQLWTGVRGRRVGEWERSMGIKMLDCEGGSSGYIALRVALLLGATHIVLAGIPMENSYGQYDTGKDWDEADIHWKTWEKLPMIEKVRVRSLSGRTRRFFGYPTGDWLSQTVHPHVLDLTVTPSE